MLQKRIKRIEMQHSLTRIRRHIERLEGAAAVGVSDLVELTELHMKITDELRFMERLVDRILARCPNG